MGLEIPDPDVDEAAYYHHYLAEGMGLLCNAVGMDSEHYDRDQADGECYADCFRDMADALQQHCIRFDVEEGEFIRSKECDVSEAMIIDENNNLRTRLNTVRLLVQEIYRNHGEDSEINELCNKALSEIEG